MNPARFVRLHETTLALLRHLRGLPQLAAPPIDWGLVNAWEAAGYPDLDAPEPDRLAELEARLASLESGVKALAELYTETASRVDALEHPPASPAPPPEPAFVPTAPGRYIRHPSTGPQTVDVWRGTDGVLRWGPMLRVDDSLTACWVGPVARSTSYQEEHGETRVGDAQPLPDDYSPLLTSAHFRRKTT